MTDKEIIETLQGIKAHCTTGNYFDLCQRCRFHYENGCQLINIARVLGLSTPNSWNLEKIERIINETD